MPRKPRKKKGVVHIWGYEININVIITTVLAAITWALLSAGLTWARNTNLKVSTILHEFPGVKRDMVTVKQDVGQIKQEQDRFKKQYAPPVSPAH